MSGKERSRAEFKDIFEASFKTGIFAELEISFWEILLAPGENNHFEPSENRQFQPNKKSHCHNS
ncbi:MAG: hypothetical protein IIW80_08410 [Treponema sp.]|nr:hypothetical protein [Treponema sp.]